MTMLSEKLTNAVIQSHRMQAEFSKFPTLFKKYRLKAEFATLSALGLALAGKGLIYEDSIFSHWQKGDRLPNRTTIIKLIELFIERQAIQSRQEANEFLSSAGQGYLTNTEIDILPEKLVSNVPFQVPAEIDYFTGRENYIETIKIPLLEGKVIHIYGQAGVGKTTLAIKIGYLLRHAFPDGVLWCRLDTSDTMSTLSGVAQSLGENINEIKNVEVRASIVRGLISSKKLLIIFDNVEHNSMLYLMLPNSSLCSIIITSKYKHLEIPTSHVPIFLEPFTEKESLSIFLKILEEKYVAINKQKLLEIARSLGNLPLAVNIFAKQITHSSKNIKVLFSYLNKEKLKINSLRYENKSLYASLYMSYKVLKAREKKVFASLSVFAGKDFSINAVSAITKLRMKDVEDSIESILNMSLIERSTSKRYRIHPLVKVFIQEKFLQTSLISQAAKYYEDFLKKCGRGESKYYPQIETELDNIVFIFKKSYVLNSWNSVLLLWTHIGVFLWDTGRWNIVKTLGKLAYNAAVKCKNDYMVALCCIRELSWLYYWTGELPEATKWAEKGLHIANTTNNSYLIAYAKQRLGKIYQSKHQYLNSEKMLKQSIQIFMSLKNFERLGDTLTYLAELYTLMGNLKDSEKYLKKAQNLTKKINDINQHAIVLGYLGEVNYLKKNYNFAKECFEKSLSVTRIKGVNVGGKVWCNIGLALIQEKLGNQKQTQKLLRIVQENIKVLGIRYDQSRPLMKDYKRLTEAMRYSTS